MPGVVEACVTAGKEMRVSYVRARPEVRGRREVSKTGLSAASCWSPTSNNQALNVCFSFCLWFALGKSDRHEEELKREIKLAVGEVLEV